MYHLHGQTKTEPAILAMADGSVFEGVSVGASTEAVGELVFNTSMSGYQEILSDPSYASQLIAFTYPHIGNVGVNPDDWESDKFHSVAVVLREPYPMIAGHRGKQTLFDVLVKQKVPAIAGVDTRRITQLLRHEGSMNACLDASKKPNRERALKRAKDFSGLAGMNLTGEVTGTYTKQPNWSEGGWRPQSDFYRPSECKSNVVVYDFGVKRSILRNLVDRACKLHIVDATTPTSEVLSMKPDGIVLSNGPGDPAACDEIIEGVRSLVSSGVPLLGICLGHQILAHACGARTVKMKFGHHGANHPVQTLSDGLVWITSQNHGFAVDESSIPKELEVTHKSLFDGSVQGFRHKKYPVFGFQGHPEAGPGPHDAYGLFDDFAQAMS